MKKVDLKDIFGLTLGLAVSDFVQEFIPYVIIWGHPFKTGSLTFVIFMLVTMTRNLASKALEKLIRKIVTEVKKELNQ